MKPRKLRYLRIDDDPPPQMADLALRLPIEIEEIDQWYEFCKSIRNHKQWNSELMTIDFNFKEDNSGPWFPLRMDDPYEHNNEFLNDTKLRQMRWPDSLVEDYIGPNTGLFIGLHLVAWAEFRDLPCGVGFRTAHPQMIVKDTPSAMIATQILLAAGVRLPIGRARETLHEVVRLIESGSGKPDIEALLFALEHFREEFLGRAGVLSSAITPVRLWMESPSLWTLLNVFQSALTADELDRRLAEVGIEFYDRDGKLDCLDVRSIFFDRLYRQDENGIFQVVPRLQLSDVQPGALDKDSGLIWQFIADLAAKTPSNIGPVLEFFRELRRTGRPPGSINKTTKRPEHRLIAFVFAWLYEYGEKWIASSRESWDPFEDTFDGSFAPMTNQISAFLRIVDSALQQERPTDSPAQHETLFVPVSHPKNLSLMRIMRAFCTHGSILTGPLRYDGPDWAEYQDKREQAVKLMADVAVRWGCMESKPTPLEPTKSFYRVKSRYIPDLRPMRINQKDVARNLGVGDALNADPSNELRRIIKSCPGFENYSVESFLAALEERPLPQYMRQAAWEFIDEFWAPGSGSNIPQYGWPPCVADPEPQQVSYRKQQHRESLHSASRLHAQIVPSTLKSADEHFAFWCQRTIAEEVGGDYYRVRHLDSKGVRIYFGDVCGRGWPAALIVQELHGLIRALESRMLTPDQICQELNRKLGDVNGTYEEDRLALEAQALPGRWATFICADLDPTTNTLRYTNAGHPQPLLIRKDGSVYKLTPQAQPVGMFVRSVYSCTDVPLFSGDRIIFFTDGLVEDDEDDPLISESELERFVIDNRWHSATEIGEAVMKRLHREPSDDITLMVVAVMDAS